VDEVGEHCHLAGADDRVVEKAGAAEVAIRLVQRGLVERVAKPVSVATVHLAFDQPGVDRLAGVVDDHVAQHVDVAGLGVDRDDTGVAAARESERTDGVEAFEHLEAFVGNHVRRRHPFGGRAANFDEAVDQHQVLDVGFEDLARALEQPLPHRRRC
jgi:hypothetical protein